ncbi:MAG: hypothetical protein JST40_12035 [Armatimonadetes bacterium]|nr:hypothetical protein [Armatimonadota bacterium]
MKNSMLRTLLFGIAALALLPTLVGCSSNPTNEPSDNDIKTAVDKKMKAIDEDPSMTPEQKEEMKKHISGYPKSSNGSR